MELEQLVPCIFCAQPGPPHSLQLEILEGQASHDVFRALGQLLTHGIVHLYGSPSTWPDDVVWEPTSPAVLHLQRCLAAIGWRAVLNPSSAAEHPQALPWLLRIPMGPTAYLRVGFEPQPWAT